MAVMFPKAPDRLDAGDREIWLGLAQLPDEVMVFFHRHLGRDRRVEAWIVLLHASRGAVVVLEQHELATISEKIDAALELMPGAKVHAAALPRPLAAADAAALPATVATWWPAFSPPGWMPRAAAALRRDDDGYQPVARAGAQSSAGPGDAPPGDAPPEQVGRHDQEAAGRAPPGPPPLDPLHAAFPDPPLPADWPHDEPPPEEPKVVVPLGGSPGLPLRRNGPVPLTPGVMFVGSGEQVARLARSEGRRLAPTPPSGPAGDLVAQFRAARALPSLPRAVKLRRTRMVNTDPEVVRARQALRTMVGGLYQDAQRAALLIERMGTQIDDEDGPERAALIVRGNPARFGDLATLRDTLPDEDALVAHLEALRTALARASDKASRRFPAIAAPPSANHDLDLQEMSG